jgi:hypothetical protein
MSTAWFSTDGEAATVSRTARAGDEARHLRNDEQPVRNLPVTPEWMGAQVLWSRTLRLIRD